MKKTIFKSLFFLFIFGIMLSCSSDSANDAVLVNDSANASVTARGTVWDGVIGEERAPGKYVITADPAVLMSDLEDVLRQEGNQTLLKSLKIYQKTASNDPNDISYMLVGSNNMGISIGVFLTKTNNEFTMALNTAATTTTCTGCATGCNLQYLLIDGKRVAYCNENGCIYDCTKSESNYL